MLVTAHQGGHQLKAVQRGVDGANAEIGRPAGKGHVHGREKVGDQVVASLGVDVLVKGGKDADLAHAGDGDTLQALLVWIAGRFQAVQWDASVLVCWRGAGAAALGQDDDTAERLFTRRIGGRCGKEG
jgi:hypothetical protein